MSNQNHDPESPSPRGSHRAWRRRQYVVDARYQLRAGILVGAVAVALLVLVNLSLVGRPIPAAGRLAGAAAGQAPPSGVDGTTWALILLGSGVFVVGVVAIGVLESHRTAGAAYAIRRSLEQIREGHSGVRVRLRRGDHLQDLARAVNELAASIDAQRSDRI